MIGERFAVDFYDKREAPALEEGQTLYLDKAERPDVDESTNAITRSTLGVSDSYGMLDGFVPDRLVNRLRIAKLVLVAIVILLMIVVLESI